jgi:hypothetical protein
MMREEEYLDDVNYGDALGVGDELPPVEALPVEDVPANDLEAASADLRRGSRPVRFTSLQEISSPETEPVSGSRILRGIGRGLTALGRGDVGAYDSNTRYNDEAPNRARMNALKASEMAETLEGKQRSKALAMARIDPASNESRQAQTDYIDELKAASELPGIPDGFKKSLLEMAAGASSMSAARIDAIRPQVTGRLNMMLKAADIQAKQNLASANMGLKQEQINATRDNNTAQRGIQYEGLRLRADENAERREERNESATEKAVAAYEKEAAPLTAQQTLVGEVKAASEAGKINTGAIAARLQKVRQFLGIEDKDWDTAEGRLGAARNEIRHALFGGALSPTEAAEFEKELPGMDTDDPTFQTKLATTLEKIALAKQAAARRNPRGASKSNPDPNAAARDWLKKNPNHPMAEKVRKKLEGL